MKQTKQTEHKQVSFRRLVHDALPEMRSFQFFTSLMIVLPVFSFCQVIFCMSFYLFFVLFALTFKLWIVYFTNQTFFYRRIYQFRLQNHSHRHMKYLHEMRFPHID